MIFVNHGLDFNGDPPLIRETMAIVNNSQRHRNDNLSSYFGKKCARGKMISLDGVWTQTPCTIAFEQLGQWKRADCNYVIVEVFVT